MRASNLKWAAWMGLSLVTLMAGAAKAQTSILDSPGSTAAAAAGESERDDIDISKVEILDTSLKTKLSFQRIVAHRSTSNLLNVSVGLSNNTGREVTFEVETIYKDKYGALLNKGSWIRFTLKPHEATDYRSSSLSDDAVDFTIRLRRPLPAVAR